LSRGAVAALLDLEACIEAVDAGLRAQASGRAGPSGVLGIEARAGRFHIKAAWIDLGRSYFAAKVNGNFPLNTERYGLPRIQGAIVLCDATTGSPLAVMDSIEITTLRTGAATAIAARHLARRDASVASVCGCGVQGRVQLLALACVRRLRHAYAYDAAPARAERFASEMSGQLGILVEAVRDPSGALARSDLCVTCTPSTRFFVGRDDLRPGTFLAAVGADAEGKQEIDPRVVALAKLVVDSLEQCALIGELQYALEEELLLPEEVHAELWEVVAGLKTGRSSEDEIIVFDSTGTAIQDVAAAAAVYERAVREGVGLRVDLGAPAA
jgi:alanine dehydrogenase